jgi:lactate dehydrogenase-like 2-hydroxyacid dehydrogenase
MCRDSDLAFRTWAQAPRIPMRTADAAYTMSELKPLLPEAYFAALTCPLTKEIEKLVDAEALCRMIPSAHLANMAP